MCVCHALLFHDRSVFTVPLGQLSRVPIVRRPDGKDIQATSCIAVGQWWSTLIVTFRTHVSFHSLFSRVSHCDDATCAATSLRIVVATDKFERAARHTLRFTPFPLFVPLFVPHFVDGAFVGLSESSSRLLVLRQ